MRLRPVLLAPLLALPLFGADPLSDLRARLQGAKPAAPFSARIEIRAASANDDEGAQSRNERVAAIEATHDAGGVRLRWSQAELDRARRDKAAAERNPDAPKTGGLAALDAAEAHNLLDAAPDLLLDLEGATLLESKPDAYEGKPATLLVITPRVSMSQKDRKRIKQYDVSAKLWLDAEGWPLAMEYRQHLKASMMLISFVSDTTEKRVYGRAGDRLFVLSAVRDSSGAGFGQKGSDHRVTTVTPLNGQGNGAGSAPASAARAGS